MTILEFIRKNSLLVIIVIVGVGAGLVMMDYSGKSSAFSRDYYIRVDGTSYSYPEAASLGENGKEFLHSLFSATRQLTDPFDVNEDGQIDEQEEAALREWQAEHPEVGAFVNFLNELYSSWVYGVSDNDATNVAINRAKIKSEADKLGLHPSEAQIDAYLRAMPPFRTADGGFNSELYQRLAGYRRGNANRVQEEAFRDVIADMIIWEALQSIISTDIHYNTKAQLAMIDAFTQSVRGRTAWLPADQVPAPAEPTEEELQAYWEQHKADYQSDERRIITVYTLSPGQDSNMENLLYTADGIMQDLSQANGQGLDKLLADAAENPEYDPFSYKAEDGSTHKTFALSTKKELQAQLPDIVNYDGAETALAEVAFSELANAPGVAAYEADAAAGTPDAHATIRQIRGFYNSTDGKLKIVRIEAVEPPSILPYEQAKDKALTDFKAERAANALQLAANKLYEDMNTTLKEGQGLQAAFDQASGQGAQVESYGPLDLRFGSTALPLGVSDEDILGTPSGKLTPIAILPNGARITSVEERTVESTPAIVMQKRMLLMPAENARLRHSMMQEWMNAAYARGDIQLSPYVQVRGAK